MTRIHKVFLSIGLAALLAGGSIAILPSLRWGDRIDYSHVVSIEDAREYRDPALLKKAWALPVAMLYQSNIDFQRNPSVCGPASIVNVLRSLNRPGDQATILDGTGISTVLGHLPGGITRARSRRQPKVWAVAGEIGAAVRGDEHGGRREPDEARAAVDRMSARLERSRPFYCWPTRQGRRSPARSCRVGDTKSGAYCAEWLNANLPECRGRAR
jgi:hypothetical protein